MSQIGESHVEEAALAWLAELGYATLHGQTIGPDAATPERTSYGDVVLAGAGAPVVQGLDGVPFRRLRSLSDKSVSGVDAFAKTCSSGRLRA